MRLEALFRKSDGHLGEYETVNGSLITVYTLTPEEFVKEKVSAYLGRKKVRDLYDIFFLLRYVKDRKAVKPDLEKLLKNYSEQVDEKDLKVLIIDGPAPSSGKMLEYVKRW